MAAVRAAARGKAPRKFVRYAALPRAETARLVALAQDEGLDPEARSAARSAAVLGNYPLALKIARSYSLPDVEPEDIEQEAVLGLYDAVDGYDPAKGAFSTYAPWWIRNAINRFWLNRSRLVRYPVWIQGKLAVAARLQAAGLDPEAARLEASGGLPGRSRLLKAALQTRRLSTGDLAGYGDWDDEESTRLPGHGRTGLDRLAAAPEADPGEAIDREAMLRRLRRELRRLYPRDLRILEHRYELDGHAFMTLQELGDLLGITKEAIRQAETRALGRLARLLARPDTDALPGDTP